MEQNSVNEKLFALLKERGITQKALSQMTGIPESTISDWKRKGKTPGADKIVEVCSALEISPNDLLEQSDNTIRERDVDINSVVAKFKKLNLGQQQRLVRYLDIILLEQDRKQN